MTNHYIVDNVSGTFDTLDDAIAAAHAFLDTAPVAWLYVRHRLPHGLYVKVRIHADGTVQPLSI